MPFDLYVFDLDGTLYRGMEPIPYAVNVVNQLIERGAKIAYVTNNAGQTIASFTEKLEGMGFSTSGQIVLNSGDAAASLLKEKGIEKVFLVGMPGLHTTFADKGLRVVNDSGDQAEAVVVGICRTFTYDLLRQAMAQIKGGAVFYATNPDATFPTEGGGLTPGAGSLVAAVATCSETEPIVIGKPQPYLMEESMRRAGVLADRTLAIGDRYETDIVSGKAAGCHTHMVLTGVSKKAPEGQSVSDDLRAVLDL